MNQTLNDLIAAALQGSSTTTEDSTVTAFLSTHVPALEQAARDALTPPLTAGEVFTVIQRVSTAAQEGLAALAGAERKAVVKATVKYLFRTYAAGRLPGVVSLLLTDSVLDNVIEFIYQGIVKARGGTQ